MRRLLIVPVMAAGVVLMALPAAASSPVRVIGDTAQGSSTFEQANQGGPVDLIGSYAGLRPGNYRAAVYSTSTCQGQRRLLSGVFQPVNGSVVTQQSLGAFDLTSVKSVGLLRWGKLVGCNTHPVVVKGGPF